MNVLQLGSDRTPYGNLNPKGTAIQRQIAYGKRFGHLDLASFSLRSEQWETYSPSPEVTVYPTRSFSRLLYGIDAFFMALRIAKPDVVSAQDPFETGLVAWIIAKTRGAKLHVQVHTDIFSEAFLQSSFLHRMRAMLARFVLRRAERIRVVSPRIRDSLKPLRLRGAVSVIPIFVDVERFKNIQPEVGIEARFKRFSHRFLVVSRLEKEKNVELALRAFVEAAQADSCLIIVGDGTQKAWLYRLAQRLRISDRIFFEGSSDPAPYYAIADLVLVPSKYEGYGLVVVEALAAGKPVLSTDVGIARDAGANISTEQEYAAKLGDLMQKGVKSGKLALKMYQDFDEYADAYAEDIEACVRPAN